MTTAGFGVAVHRSTGQPQQRAIIPTMTTREPIRLTDMQRDALEVLRRYDDLSTRAIGRTWTNTEVALGFVGDVGDLSKFVMAEEGARSFPGDNRARLIHELCDCIWSCLVLADRYNIDLATEFPAQMDDLRNHIASLEGPTQTTHLGS